MYKYSVQSLELDRPTLSSASECCSLPQWVKGGDPIPTATLVLYVYYNPSTQKCTGGGGIFHRFSFSLIRQIDK
jgi:hypothetical protein